MVSCRALLTLVAGLASVSAATAFVPSLLGVPARRHVQTCRAGAPALRMAGVGVPGGESLAEQEYEVPPGCRKVRIPTV
jgi:hypothetical protein